MNKDVYRAFDIGNGRYGIEKLKKFLWFTSWKPVPDIYIELDRIQQEELELENRLKVLKKQKKEAHNTINNWIKFANASFQAYSKTLSPRQLKKSRIDPRLLEDLYNIPTSVPKNKTGPPGFISTGPSDLPPRQSGGNSNNQKKQQQN